MYNIARKQYVWTAVKDKSWVRGTVYNADNVQHEIKVRGLEFSKMDPILVKRIYNEIIIPLLANIGPVDAVKLFNDFYDKEVKTFEDNIENLDYIRLFARKIKDTLRNPITMILRQKYSYILGDNQIWNVVPNRGYDKRACSYMPIELLNKDNCRQIDIG
jgi:hypothetical protein